MSHRLHARPVPVTLNLHLTKHCNYHCTFCWATFRDVLGDQSRDEWLQLIAVVAAERAVSPGYVVDKITFAGGEPTLLPYLPELIEQAKRHGFTTCVVTNGTRVPENFLHRVAPWLDWITVSLDSGDDAATNARIGRGRKSGTTGHVETIRRAARLVRRHPTHPGPPEHGRAPREPSRGHVVDRPRHRA